MVASTEMGISTPMLALGAIWKMITRLQEED